MASPARGPGRLGRPLSDRLDAVADVLSAALSAIREQQAMVSFFFYFFFGSTFLSLFFVSSHPPF